MVVDSDGLITAEGTPGFEGIVVGGITPGRRFTLYSVLGDWFIFACLVFLGLKAAGFLARNAGWIGQSKIATAPTFPSASKS